MVQEVPAIQELLVLQEQPVPQELERLEVVQVLLAEQV